jgi:hypothetical protein
MAGAAVQWRELVANIEGLAKHAKPDELEAARMILHDYIGEVPVVENTARSLRPRQSEQRRGSKVGARRGLDRFR